MRRVDEIRTIPISAIAVPSHRVRSRRSFTELVTSIDHLGLKRPITVNIRGCDNSYELICGEGRIEAFRALGRTEIPAILIDAAAEEGLLMSLVENLARRRYSPIELLREITRLANCGYRIGDIAAKVDFSPTYVRAVCYLLRRGEERLLAAVDGNAIPPSIAIEIAKADSGAAQKALLDVYAEKARTANQIAAIRKLVEQRHLNGKEAKGSELKKSRVSAVSLVRTYRREGARQQAVAKKAELTHARLIFIVNALRELCKERLFLKLLREDRLQDMPLQLQIRISAQDG